MELIRYWKPIRKRLWLIILLVVLALAGATYVTLQQVPLYRTTTRLILRPGSSNPLIPGYVSSSTQDLATTYAEFMRTQRFAGLLQERFESDLTPDEILAAITTRYVPSQFFDISVTSSNPALAQTLANTAADVFISENIARQQAEQQQARAQQDPVQEAERERLKELQQSLQDELDYYGQRIASLQTQIDGLENGPPSAEADQRILDMRGELVRNQGLRVDALTTLAQTQAALVNGQPATSADTAVVIDPALLPTKPINQTSFQLILAAIFGALALGVGIALMLDYLDYSIKTPEELDAFYGMPALGVTGVIGGREQRNRQVEELITITEPRSPITEAFRALRTNIQFANPEGTMRSLLVTSAGPGEGKTVTASNLAVIMAQAGQRVILVDADLRKPKVHRLFKVPKTPGLSNLIIDPHADVAAYLQETDVPNLSVITCGIRPPNPAELLGSARAAEVMQELAQRADVVIYDTPPAATVTDAVVLATRVDGVLQVVLAGKTRRDLVLQGKAVLEKVGAHILGPVLNEVNVGDLGYYSYYYYYGGYYQESEDGDEGSKPKSGKRAGGRSRPRKQPASPPSPTAPAVSATGDVET